MEEPGAEVEVVDPDAAAASPAPDELSFFWSLSLAELLPFDDVRLSVR